MPKAAYLEDAKEKKSVPPVELRPARGSSGDMRMELHKSADVFTAIETYLLSRYNRFNSLYGAVYVAEKSGDTKK